MDSIVLAGGCFWGVEAYFKRVKGVIGTRVGYAQGEKENPTYKEVCEGDTGHAEVCDVIFDENEISLEKILEHFFRIIDPTSLNRQGGDEGPQYRTGIYCNTNDRLEEIKEIIKEVQKKYEEKIVTEVDILDIFYDAEEYHQEYLQKNPSGYCHVDFSLIKPEERQNPIENN
ncbi:MAG: peptide-methionine (S)-S-oxide reductase MsrA [Fusobacteriaceae bacterium]|nr:peptide-methionine (S)-S-oxide reductase MsrA [Fusobacteriaceae bacterium]MBN2838965.1 peptide-methionine (S)-S-oxide reductase MsrA [Fusobacteriaceae bacterium]